MSKHDDDQPGRPARDSSGRWLPGQTGNAGGRPRGKTWASQMRERLRRESVAEVLAAMHQVARLGNVDAAKLLIGLVLPAARPGDEEVALGNTGTNPADQARAVAHAMVAGKLAPAAATDLLQALKLAQDVVDMAALEARLADLEARLRAP